MNMKKFPTVRNLVKVHLSFCAKKDYFYKVNLRYFTSTHCYLSEKSEKNISKLSYTELEKINNVKTLLKRNNKLSVVEEKDIKVVEELKKGNIFYPNDGPFDRMKNILIEDGKVAFRKAFKSVTNVQLGELKKKYFIRHSDILIIGGGAVGLLIAYAIRSTFPHGPTVTVVDKDNSFLHSSINLGQSMINQQLFNEEEEIEILKYAAEFFSAFTRNTRCTGMPDIKLNYDPLGSLILADVDNADKLIKNNEILKLYGIYNKILSKETLKTKFPWLNLADVLFGSLGLCNNGVIDPWTFFCGIKCKCLNLGVHFEGAEVIDFGYSNGAPVRAICKLPSGSYNSIDFAYCVVACGIESFNIIDLFNSSNNFNLMIKLPLEERARYEYCFYNPDGPELNTPIVLDSEGTYFRREGLSGHYVVGVPSVVNLESEESGPFQVFENKVRPFLMKRVPQFKEVELKKGWIDLFEYCFANNVGITGPHPETSKIVFAFGFSHFGITFLPALARAVMEYILYDKYQTIDFTPFHIENVWKKKHLEYEKKKQELIESQGQIAIEE